MPDLSAQRVVGAVRHRVHQRLIPVRQKVEPSIFRLERRAGPWIARRYVRLLVDRLLTVEAFAKEDALEISQGRLLDLDDPRPHWFGVPTWKLPVDLWVIQEIITATKPDLLVETGTKYGGSTLFYAHVLDAIGGGEVITVDYEPELVHPAVTAHPRVRLIGGDSAGAEAVSEIRKAAEGKRVMVILDSDHQHAHVRKELEAYSDLVSPGCYLVVEDTALGRTYLPGLGDSGGALEGWMAEHPEFEVDGVREKFVATLQPGGYLRRRAD